MHYCSFVHDDNMMPEEIRETLESTMFETLVLGGAKPYSAAAPTPTPVALADAVRQIVHHARFLHITRGDEILAEKVSHDAVHWCANQWAQANEDDPFRLEAERCDRFRLEYGSASVAGASVASPAAAGVSSARASVADAATADDSAESASSPTASIADTSVDAASSSPTLDVPESVLGEPLERLAYIPALRDYVQNKTYREITAATPHARVLRIERRAALRALGDEWHANLAARKSEYEIRFIRRALLPYVAELNERVPAMKQYVETMRDFFGTTNGLWDRAAGVWQSVDLPVLNRYSDELAREPAIREFVDLLGRLRGEAETERPEIEEHTIEVAVRFRSGAGRSEITGIHFSDDLSSVLASEVALLSDSASEQLFYKKLAERELLTLRYTAEATYRRTEYRTEVVRRTKPVENGPLIACIDTSGSMAGEPERVAKTFLLALLKAGARPRPAPDMTAGPRKRAVFLIAFSDRVRTLDLSEPSAGLADAIEFLSHSFHGGTDLRPALNTTFDTIETQSFRNADVLVISDFRVPKILDHHIGRILHFQRTVGTRFYSLTVQPQPVIDTLNVFDRAWRYDAKRRALIET